MGYEAGYPGHSASFGQEKDHDLTFVRLRPEYEPHNEFCNLTD